MGAILSALMGPTEIVPPLIDARDATLKLLAQVKPYTEFIITAKQISETLEIWSEKVDQLVKEERRNKVKREIGRSAGVLDPDMLGKFIEETFRKHQVVEISRKYTEDTAGLTLQLIRLHNNIKDVDKKESDRIINRINKLMLSLKETERDELKTEMTKDKKKYDDVNLFFQADAIRNKVDEEIDNSEGVLNPDKLREFLRITFGKSKVVEISNGYTEDTKGLILQLILLYKKIKHVDKRKSDRIDRIIRKLIESLEAREKRNLKNQLQEISSERKIRLDYWLDLASQ